MILDSSALVAILLDEPEGPQFLRLVDESGRVQISAATLVEVSIVLEARRGEAAVRELDLLLLRSDAEVVSVNREQAEIARRAWRKYGRGNHPAQLNFGDCFAYALAKVTGEALLFKGNDFSQTDVDLAA